MSRRKRPVKVEEDLHSFLKRKKKEMREIGKDVSSISDALKELLSDDFPELDKDGSNFLG